MALFAGGFTNPILRLEAPVDLYSNEKLHAEWRLFGLLPRVLLMMIALL